MGCVRPGTTTETIVYRDAWGHRQEVRVTSADAQAIRRIRVQARRADRKWRDRHETFTDAGIDPRTLQSGAAPAARPSQAGNPWQGPRFSFTALIGEGRIWPGPRLADVGPLLRERDYTPWAVAVRKRAARGRCDFCRGAWLGPQTYCARCDRSGRDREIPRPSKTELSRIRAPEDDGLRGGV